MDTLLLYGVFLQRKLKCFSNVTKYLTASKIIAEDGERSLCLKLVYLHITEKNEQFTSQKNVR